MHASRARQSERSADRLIRRLRPARAALRRHGTCTQRYSRPTAGRRALGASRGQLVDGKPPGRNAHAGDLCLLAPQHRRQGHGQGTTGEAIPCARLGGPHEKTTGVSPVFSPPSEGLTRSGRSGSALRPQRALACGAAVHGWLARPFPWRGAPHSPDRASHRCRTSPRAVPAAARG